MSKRKNPKDVVFFFIVLILVLVMIYSGLRILESTVFRSEGQAQPIVSKTITRNGVDYFPRQDLDVIMVLGIDQSGPAVDSGEYYNEGLCDVVFLLIFDQTNENLRILSLNRDTMMDVPTLGNGGKRTGTVFGQLALAHTYGSGLGDSCENARETVSDFLYDLEIGHYISLRLDAVSLLNDAVGGVTVNVEEDFSEIDPSITMGEMVLRGDQAITYIRSRKNVGDQMNVSRMERQKKYVRGFLDAMDARLAEDSSFALNTFEQVSAYMVTDFSLNGLSSLLSRYEDYPLVEIISPEGESVRGEQYMEFHVDEQALDDLIVRLFYKPKK